MRGMPRPWVFVVYLLQSDNPHLLVGGIPRQGWSVDQEQDLIGVGRESRHAINGVAETLLVLTCSGSAVMHLHMYVAVKALYVINGLIISLRIVRSIAAFL
ncbi:hypothetical protein SCLCIDRAFT_1220004 [Scleroderma citrinum Foug A]|uniref:Uncharacterized protein n=1 Tax=Scleroderma citrinum Foug A TaxID=1036808 RepID=A0A0C2ZW94_9AGAM|nr:hypothetical protein SCLCIDRAFT_1220004 [Scleroderma citrinum Foug A]